VDGKEKIIREKFGPGFLGGGEETISPAEG